MFRTLSVALSTMLLYLLSLPATADSDPRRQTVARMGELNGVALACRYFDQTRRMKRILIDHLPKERSLGQLFDDRTNQSFLAFVDSGRGCPSPAQFAGEVDQAEQALIQAYDPEGDKPGR